MAESADFHPRQADRGFTDRKEYKLGPFRCTCQIYTTLDRLNYDSSRSYVYSRKFRQFAFTSGLLARKMSRKIYIISLVGSIGES